MWRIVLTILLLATQAHALTVTVEKRGAGTADITGSIACPRTSAVCTEDRMAGETLTLNYVPDETNASLLGWGGLCAQWENSPTCTVALDATAAKRFGGRYNIIAALGFYQDGICRAGLIGPLNWIYFWSLQEAVASVTAGQSYNPIECTMQEYLSLAPVTSNITINGGYPSFTPNTYPNGTVSIIGGEVVVTTGTLTLGQYGGIAIACGYTTVTGPYTITTTLTIGADPCNFGLIVR